MIPADIAWGAAARLAEHGTLKRGYLGVAGQAATLGVRQQAANGRRQGLLIVEVSPGSPADTGGILIGDVVTAFDGEPIESAGGLVGPAGRRPCRPDGRHPSAPQRYGHGAERDRRH